MTKEILIGRRFKEGLNWNDLFRKEKQLAICGSRSVDSNQRFEDKWQSGSSIVRRKRHGLMCPLALPSIRKKLSYGFQPSSGYA